MDQVRRKFLIGTSLGYVGAVTMGLWGREGFAQNITRTASCQGFPTAGLWDVGPGQKFSTDGKAQAYAGNTIICPIGASNPAFAELCSAYESLRASTGSGNLAWLPAGSYHSTIFDGATDVNRRPGDWPQMLPLDASMEECNRNVADRLRHMSTGIAAPIRMMVDTDAMDGVRTVVFLKPVDAAENRRVRKLRDEISLVTGIRHANHDDYRFHTSFAYYVRLFTPDAEARYRSAYAQMLQRLNKNLPVIELGSPEYSLFKDMLAYKAIFPLKSAG